MKEIIHFLLKGIFKRKYIFILPLAICTLILTLLIINSTQSGKTQQELQETFKNQKDTVSILINNVLKKEQVVGLSPLEQQSLDSLLLKEEYLKKISKKLNDGNLDIATEQLAFINEYENFLSFHSTPYLNENVLAVEKLKAKELLEHNLSYTEQITPYKTALFTKQLLQIFFNPITALLILLVFCYNYMSDRENRIFDFFKMKSLTSVAVYYGYFIPLLLIILLYIFIACMLSLLPPLLTGNINTIFYPLEVAVNSEIILVPVWKWLVFIPIGWGIFISLLLVLIICLFKYQAKLGILFSLISLPILISYIISLKIGFHLLNPIHLLFSYESNLLSTNRFVLYLCIMISLLFICFIFSYVVIRNKTIKLKLPELYTTKKQYQLTSKFKLLQFEHVKKKRKGHFLFTLILLFGFIGGTVTLVNQQFQTIHIKALKSIENFQNIAIQDRTRWELAAADFELEQEMQKMLHEQSGEELQTLDKNPFENYIEHSINKYNVLENLKKEIHSENFTEKYKETMQPFEAPISYKEMENTSLTVTNIASEEQQNILNAKGITPWALGYSWVSNFDTPDNALGSEHYERLKMFQDLNTKYDNSSLFTIYKFLDWNVIFFVLLLFLLVLWTTISEEHVVNPTINFLTTKPIRLNSIYIAKWTYNLLTAFSLLLICGAFVFLFATLIGGLGDPEYPILIYATERLEEHFFYSLADDCYFYFNSLVTLILKSGILIIVQIFFLNSLYSLVGKLIKNNYVSIIVTLIIVFVGYFFGNHYIDMSNMYINPFVYFDTWNIIDGWKSIEANNGKVNFLNGTLTLFISGSLLFCIGLLRKRRFN